MPNPIQLRAILGGQTIRYLLGPFRFSVNQSAPLTSPYSEAGAAGSLTVVDTENKLSISGGKLVLAGGKATPAFGDPSIGGGLTTRVVGRAQFVDVALSSVVDGIIGFLHSALPAAANDAHGFRFNSATNIVVREAGGASSLQVGALTLSNTNRFAIVLRSAGAFYLVCPQGATTWTLVWIAATSTQASGYSGVVDFNLTGTVDNLRVLDVGTLDARFATDEGLATGRKATSIAGDTITQTADALVEHTLTAATGVDKDLYVRWTDDNNCWIVRQNQAGSTVKLIEKVAGVETSRMSVAQTFTNGTAYRMIAVCDGASITVYVNTTKAGTYASATTNQTATTAKAPAAGTEFKAYPRYVTLPSGL